MTDTNIYNDDNSKSRNRESAENAKKDIKVIPAQKSERPNGTDPTRFGDWEKNGKCVDF
jgi:hypothetical protein